MGGAGTETEDTHLDRENAHRHSVGTGGGGGVVGRKTWAGLFGDGGLAARLTSLQRFSPQNCDGGEGGGAGRGYRPSGTFKRCVLTSQTSFLPAATVWT